MMSNWWTSVKIAIHWVMGGRLGGLARHSTIKENREEGGRGGKGGEWSGAEGGRREGNGREQGLLSQHITQMWTDARCGPIPDVDPIAHRNSNEGAANTGPHLRGGAFAYYRCDDGLGLRRPREVFFFFFRLPKSKTNMPF